AAIEEANAHAGNDGIYFGIPTTDPGYSNGRWTISLTRTLPNISEGVNINGPGSDKLSILGRQLFYNVFNVTASGTVSFNDVTISNGYASAPSGGAIYTGGGINNKNGGTVNVTNCTLSGNVGDHGGGIYSNGTLNVTNS